MQQPLSSPPECDLKPRLRRRRDRLRLWRRCRRLAARARGPAACASSRRARSSSTGSFPSRLPELRRELQLNGGKMRSGSPHRPVRLQARRRYPCAGRLRARRRLADQCRGRAEARRPRLRRSGLARGALGRRAARAGLQAGGGHAAPLALRQCPRAHQIPRARIGERRVRRAAGRRAGGGELRGYRQSRRRGAARLHAVRRLLLGLQCRRQEHRGHDLSARRQGTWRGDLHRAQRQSPRQRRGGLAGLFRAVGCEGRDSERGRGEDGGARRRHARLDRDPAQIARARARPVRPPRRAASPPMATSSPSPLAARNVSTASASGVPPKFEGDIVGASSPARSSFPTRPISTTP